MLMGPVFRAELLRTARHRRYYVLRLLYGLLLLWLAWSGYERMRWLRPVTYMADVVEFATWAFVAFAVVQLIALLLLVPAVFGGAIADEKQRKTLHYLMASRLSSGEIILDKVLGRSAHLAVFVAIGVPVVGLLGLLGGISAESVVVAYVGTSSTVAFAIALTVAISTFARRVRDAILSAYLLMLMWLFVPPLIGLFGMGLRIPAYYWIRPVNDWLADTSPIWLWFRISSFPGVGTSAASTIAQFVQMVATQGALAVLLVLLAIWRLRPTFRRQEETSSRQPWFRSKGGPRRSRWLAHPECGDDPILWKERYFAPVDRFTRIVLLPAIICITLPLVLVTEVQGDFGRVVTELSMRGLEARQNLPSGFLWALQVDLGWYVGFWLLAVAGASASSVTIEREKDTWVSLTATPLTGAEVLRGKVLGATWHQRGFAVVLILLWLLGLITGAAHPIGVVLSIALVALLTWLVATVGVFASLRASSTSRAMAMTLTALACLNGYPIILFLRFMDSVGWESSYSLLGLMPSFAAWSMISPRDFERWRTFASMDDAPATVWYILGGIGLAGLFIYAGTALALTWRILRQFDHWLDRPPLSSKPAIEPAPARHLEEVTAR